MAPAASWSSWADALHMFQDRLPAVAQSVSDQLESGSLQDAAEALDRSGFVGRPSREQLRAGVRLPLDTVAEPGEWSRTPLPGYCSYCPVICCEPSPLAVSFRTRSQRTSVRSTHWTEVHAAAWCVQNSPLTGSHCECGTRLDQLGRHRGPCPRSVRLRSRAVAPERTLARICREAGAVVRTNVMLSEGHEHQCVGS